MIADLRMIVAMLLAEAVFRLALPDSSLRRGVLAGVLAQAAADERAAREAEAGR